MAKKDKAVEEAQTETAEAPATRKRVKGVSKDAKLTVLVESNPKRSGSASYDRFEGYLTDPAPTTVDEALKNGLTMGDIHYDIIHGSIEVEGAEVEEYTPTPRGPRSSSSEEAEVEDDGAEDDNF